MASALLRFLANHAPVVAVTGAGVSTASGIPDYRDADGVFKHAEPIQYGDFVRNTGVRRRYWARSHAGWPQFAAARPNDAHLALARLEYGGVVDTIITQNVDGLHHAAGSRRVIELHGNLGGVRCMSCDAVTSRSYWQQRLTEANPGRRATPSDPKPDGDAETVNGHEEFIVPDCDGCGGTIKPDVVMFGESVPRDRVRRAFDAVDSAGALLVIGSSLMVFSGFRFARHANERRLPIAIVNRGRTRADDFATIRIDGDCSHTLLPVADRLGRTGRTRDHRRSSFENESGRPSP